MGRTPLSIPRWHYPYRNPTWNEWLEKHIWRLWREEWAKVESHGLSSVKQCRSTENPYFPTTNTVLRSISQFGMRRLVVSHKSWFSKSWFQKTVVQSISTAIVFTPLFFLYRPTMFLDLDLPAIRRGFLWLSPRGRDAIKTLIVFSPPLALARCVSTTVLADNEGRSSSG